MRELLPFCLHCFDFSHTAERTINLSPCMVFCREARVVSALYCLPHGIVVLKQQQWEEEDKNHEDYLRY